MKNETINTPLTPGQETAVSLYFVLDKESGQIASGPHFLHERAENMKIMGGVVVRVSLLGVVLG